jgi:hypothetical protein
VTQYGYDTVGIRHIVLTVLFQIVLYLCNMTHTYFFIVVHIYLCITQIFSFHGTGSPLVSSMTSIHLSQNLM